MSNLTSIVSVIDRNDLPALFLSNDDKNQSKLIPIIDHIEAEAKKLVFDINTIDGQKGIKSLAFNIAKAKTAIDNAGKDKKAELSVDIKIIDGLRNMAKGRLQELQDTVRQPLTDLENKEKERKAIIEGRLEWLSSAGNATMSSDELLELIGSIEGQSIDDSWDEYKADALEAKENTMVRLKHTFVKVKKAEEDAAELEKLRAMKIEFERREAERDAADKARAEAEALAKAQADQVRLNHQRELEAQEIRAAQERRRLEDETNRLILDERRAAEARRKDLEAQAAQVKYEAEQKRLEDEQRQADKVIRDQAMTASADDLIAAGIPKTHAKKVVKLIYDRKIANLSMSF